MGSAASEEEEPEPPPLPPGSCPSSLVWILTSGSRGDHEPAAALALGLRERGHRVKVFGLFRQRSLFEAYGLDYGSLDAPPMLHPANREAKERLAALAVADGFEGPHKEEDYLFNIWLEWYELYFMTMKKCFGDGLDWPTVKVIAKEVLEGLRRLVVAGEKLGRSEEDARNTAAVLAGYAGMPADEYAPLARKQREVWREFFRGEAGEAGSGLDVMRCFIWSFWYNLERKLDAAGSEQRAQRELLDRLVDGFYAWQKIDVDSLASQLPAFFKEACSKFSTPLDAADPLGSRFSDIGPVSLQNMAFTYDAAKPEERPDLCICHSLTYPAGRHLQNLHGTPFLLWYTSKPPGSFPEVVMDFSLRLAFEDTFEGVPSISPKEGAFPFMDLVLDKRRLLASVSSVYMAKAGTCTKHLKRRCTGKWVLEEGKGSAFGTPEEQAAVEAFLGQAEDAPVYFGWGSMLYDNKELAQLVARTLQKAGRRGIFVAGCSGVTEDIMREALVEAFGEGQAEGRVHFMMKAPHERLLPRCACAVHHGGAGTCHAVLRAGVPSVVVPVMLDQYQNGDWITSLGCGVKTKSLKEMQPDALAFALTGVLNDMIMKDKAKKMAEVMAQEHGVAKAVDLVERSLLEPVPPPQPVEAKQSWLDGTYENWAGEAKLPFPPQTIRAGTIYGIDGKPVGWIRAGDFKIRDKSDGIGPGTYQIQAVWPSYWAVRFARATHGGKRILLDDGSHMRLKE